MMRRGSHRRAAIGLVAALLLGSASLALADDRDPMLVSSRPPTETDWSRVIARGEHVRLHIHDAATARSTSVVGDATWWNPGGVWVQPLDGPRERYAWDDVAGVDVGMPGKSNARGIFLGAILGAAAGLAIAQTASDTPRLGGSSAELSSIVLVPVGALFGGFMGAAITRDQMDWQPVHWRED